MSEGKVICSAASECEEKDCEHGVLHIAFRIEDDGLVCTEFDGCGSSDDKVRCVSVEEKQPTIEEGCVDKAFEAIRDEYKAITGGLPMLASAHKGYADILEVLDGLWAAIKANRRLGITQDELDKTVSLAAKTVQFIVDMTEEVEDNG